jgi:hypothetical protein
MLMSSDDGASIIAYSLAHDEVRPARLRPPRVRARDGSALQLGGPYDFPARSQLAVPLRGGRSAFCSPFIPFGRL